MDIKFNDSEDFTLGIELEMQLVDSESLALVQRSSSVIDSLKSFKDSVKHEPGRGAASNRSSSMIEPP